MILRLKKRRMQTISNFSRCEIAYFSKLPPPAYATKARCVVAKVAVVVGGNFRIMLFLEDEMEKQFYNARDIAEIMGICYAKALSFIKYSGITYVRINRTYLVKKSVFERFVSETKNIEIEL